MTGATGFAGSHLLEQLIETEPTVAAWSNPRNPRLDGSPQSDAARSRTRWTAVDLTDRAAVLQAIEALRPSVVYHCAGAADVAASWTEPARTLKLNALSTHYLLDAVHRTGLTCPVVVTGSAAIYRPSPDPLREDSPIEPSSPYGFSKLAQEMVAARAASTPVFLARAFNHAGPRQSPAYVTSSFARQIAEIEAGAGEPVLQVGNLDARRDVTDVRDTVRAYRMLVASGRPSRPYNVCSGRGYQIGDLLDALLGLARTKIRVQIDPARLRPADSAAVIGDPSRIASDVGWRPEIPIDRTLKDLLDDWRLRVAAPRS